jgi:hypothetical protein
LALKSVSHDFKLNYFLRNNLRAGHLAPPLPPLFYRSAKSGQGIAKSADLVYTIVNEFHGIRRIPGEPAPAREDISRKGYAETAAPISRIPWT